MPPFSDVTDAQHMAISPFQSGLMLVICRRETQLYTTGTCQKLLVIRCPSALGWAGGAFVTINIVVLWARVRNLGICRLLNFEYEYYILEWPRISL